MSDVIQQSFAGGEITLALQSREDLAKQQVSVAKLRNMIVTSTGSLVNRGGLKQIDEVEDMTKETRLMPFIFSTTQAYGLVWGDSTLMIIKDGALVLRDLTDGTFKWTLSGSGTSEYYMELAAGGDPSILEPHYLLENDSKLTEATIGSLTAGQWDYGDNDTLGYNTIYVRLTDSTDPDSKASGYVEIPYMITSPYSSGTQNDNIDSTQSADVMYAANKVAAPYKLTRTADDSWTLALVDLQDGPYLELGEGDEDISMTPSAKTGAGITITASDTIPNSPTAGQPFRLGYINPLDSSTIEWSWATITAVPTASTLTVTAEKDFGYEYLLNPDMSEGIGYWEDRSTNDSSIDYDPVNKRLELNKGAAGEAYAVQTVSVNTYERLTLEIVVTEVAATPNIRVQIGTTDTGTDVLAAQNITATGTYTYDTVVNEPNASPIYVQIWSATASASDKQSISRVSLMRKDLATNHWRLGAWDSDKGFPQRVALFEQSIFYANNADQPDTFWKGKTGEYESFPFNTPPLDTDAVTATLASERVNAIQAMIPYGELVMFTTGSEWRVSPAPNSDTITPTSISAKAKSNTGSGVISSNNTGTASIKPIIVKNSLLFIRQGTDGSDKKFCNVYVLGYSLDADAYDPVDLTVLAPHLFENHTIKQWAYQENPYSVIWCVRDDGILLGLTYIEDQEIWAWHVHETTGQFESVAVVPEDGEDVVYFVIRRVFNNVEKRFIERLMPAISNEDIYDWFTVDSGKTVDIENDISAAKTITDIVFVGTKIQIRYTTAAPLLQNDDYIYISGVVGTTEINKKTFRVSDSQSVGGGETGFYLKDKEGDDYIDASLYTTYVSGGEVRLGISTVSGLDHLNGQTVSVLADGSYTTKLVGALVGGGIGYELDDPEDQPAIVIHSGLPFNQDIKTLPHDFVSQNGTTSQGKNKSLTRVNIYFNKSRNAEVGVDEDSTLYTISFTDNDSGNNPPSLVTGVKDKTVEGGGYSKLTQTFIRNDKPLPMEVVGTISDVDFKEK